MVIVAVFYKKLVEALTNRTFFRAILSMAFIILTNCIPASADMEILQDNELAQITAEGFSKFTLTEGVTDIARIDMNIGVATYMDIDSMKMGYWDNGSGQGWDQNWQSVSFGSEATDLVLKDFVVEAEFENISDPANRQLIGLTVGFNNVTGTISTDFGTFSGSIKGVDHERALLGLTTVTLANEPFLMSLKISNGVSFKIGW